MEERLLISELTYTEAQLEEDTVRFIKTQIYSPAYAENLRTFLNPEIEIFRRQFCDAQNHVECLWCTDYYRGNIWKKGKLYPRPDENKLKDFISLKYIDTLRSETESLFRQVKEKLVLSIHNSSFISYRSPITNNLGVTILCGYSLNPYHSIYDIARLWCTSLHEKKFRNSDQFRLLQNIHSNIFANLYLYLKALESGDKNTTVAIRRFILQNAADITVIEDNELDLHEFDYPITKYVLQSLDPETAASLYTPKGELNFIKLYNYSFECIFQSGFATQYLRDEENFKYFYHYISEVKILKNQFRRQQKFEQFLYDMVDDQLTNQESINPYLLKEEEARRYLTPFDSYLDKYPEINDVLIKYRKMKKAAEIYHQQTRERLLNSRSNQTGNREWS